MKKLSKEQIEKRNRIKQYFLRSLHIVSYVLSALFIIVCIVVGVQSCSGKKKVNKGLKNNLSDVQLRASVEQGLEFKNIYYLRESGNNVHIPVENQQRLLTALGVTDYDLFNNVSGPSGSYIYYPTYFSSCYYYNYNNDSFEPLDHLYVTFQKYDQSSSSSYVRYRLSRIGFYSTEVNYLTKNSSYWEDNSYTLNSSISGMNTALYFTDVEQNNPILDVFYYQANKQYYFWSSILRVNFPVAPSVTSIMIQDDRFKNVLLYQVSYDTPYFISNGQLFNQIRFTYITGYYNTSQNEVRLCYGTNQPTTPGWVDRTALKNGQGLFTTMSYYNSDTENIVPVYYRDVIDDNESESSEHPYIFRVYTDKCSWTLNSYQYLIFLDELNENLLNNLDSVNNGISSLSPNGGGNYSIINVFTLISYAFTSLVPLLNIQLIPGMLIGTFIFIPLLVAIITILVRLVKK